MNFQNSCVHLSHIFPPLFFVTVYKKYVIVRNGLPSKQAILSKRLFIRGYISKKNNLLIACLFAMFLPNGNTISLLVKSVCMRPVINSHAVTCYSRCLFKHTGFRPCRLCIQSSLNKVHCPPPESDKYFA